MIAALALAYSVSFASTTQICIHASNIVAIAAKGRTEGVSVTYAQKSVEKHISECTEDSCKAVYRSIYHSIMMFSDLGEETAKSLGYARCKVDMIKFDN